MIDEENIVRRFAQVAACSSEMSSPASRRSVASAFSRLSMLLGSRATLQG